MKPRKKGKHLLRIIMVIVFVAAAFAVVLGIKDAMQKLKLFGSSTTISSEKQAEELPEKEVPEEPEPDPIPRNAYDPEGFKEENGIRTYSSDGVTGVAGIDVSSYQKSVDWQAVKDAGIEFAMIRVGYRGYVSGKLDLDDCFLDHMEGALDAGLDVGVYFFSQALTEEEAIEEAEYVLTWIEGYEINCPVVFDWEEVQAEARTDEMNMLMLTACADAFCRTVEDAGYEASVYFNQAYGYQQLNLASLLDYDFWLAEYASTPSFVYDFQMWQYTNEGKVPGIDGPVDLNIYFKR